MRPHAIVKTLGNRRDAVDARTTQSCLQTARRPPLSDFHWAPHEDAVLLGTGIPSDDRVPNLSTDQQPSVPTARSTAQTAQHIQDVLGSMDLPCLGQQRTRFFLPRLAPDRLSDTDTNE